MFDLPRLQYCLIAFAGQYFSQPRLDVVGRAKFKARHSLQHFGVQLAWTKWLSARQVRIRRPFIAFDHPGMRKNFGQGSTLVGIGDEHPRKDVLALWKGETAASTTDPMRDRHDQAHLHLAKLGTRPVPV